MDKHRKHNLINAYLNNSLTPEETKEFEALLQADVNLQLDVEIYRDIKEAFANKDDYKAWLNLQEVMQNPVPLTVTFSNRLFNFLKTYWAPLAILALISFFTVIFWPFSEIKCEKQKEENFLPVNTDSGYASMQIETTKSRLLSTDERVNKKPEYYHSGPDFVENTSFEALVLGKIMGSNEIIKVKSPLNGSNWIADKNGFSKIGFSFKLDSTIIYKSRSYEISIFNNKDNKNAMYIFSGSIDKTTDSDLSDYIENVQTLKLQPGLYYFLINLENLETFYVGKFVVTHVNN